MVLPFTREHLILPDKLWRDECLSKIRFVFPLAWFKLISLKVIDIVYELCKCSLKPMHCFCSPSLSALLSQKRSSSLCGEGWAVCAEMGKGVKASLMSAIDQLTSQTCLYVCIVWMCAAHVFLYTCGGERKLLSVFFYCFPPIPMRWGLSLNLKLFVSAMLDSQWAPGNLPVSPFQCSGYSFYLGAKDLNSCLHVCIAIAKTLTHWSNFLSQNVLFKHNFPLRIRSVL